MLTELFHQPVDNRTSTLRECCRCFVDNKQIRLIIYCSSNFDEFTILIVQLIDHCAGLDIRNTKFFKNFGCFCVHCFRINSQSFFKALFFADKNICRNGDAGNRAHFLHYHADTSFLCINHALRRICIPVVIHRPAIARLNARNN